MKYAILCYHSEAAVSAWSAEHEAAVMGRLAVVRERLTKEGRLGGALRLMPTTTALTVRKGHDPLVLDGPFAETKEQLLGVYVVECRNLEHAIETAQDLARANDPAGSYEIRPISKYFAPERPA